MNKPISSNIIGFVDSNSETQEAELNIRSLPYPLNTLVVCENDKLRRDLTPHLATISNLPVKYCSKSPDNLSHYNLVILVLSDNYNEVQFEIEKLAKHNISCILLGDNISSELIRKAIHYKVKDIISMQEIGQELYNTLFDSANDMIKTQKVAPVFTIINGKSGSGASFITSCLGEISANMSTQEIALIDADLHYGTLADTFNFDATYYLTDALSELEKLDNVAIQSMMIKRNNLSLLASKPYTLLNYNNKILNHLDQLVWKIKLNHDLVLIDLSRGLENYSMPILNLSSKILVVVQQNIVSLREAKVLIQQLTKQAGIALDKFHIIVNRYSSKSSSISLTDIKKVLGIDSLYIVSNNYQLANAGIDSGSPLLKVANNKIIHNEISHIIRDLFPIDVPLIKSTLFAKILRRL